MQKNRITGWLPLSAGKQEFQKGKKKGRKGSAAPHV
jgi:hypothetical protein